MKEKNKEKFELSDFVITDEMEFISGYGIKPFEFEFKPKIESRLVDQNGKLLDWKLK